MLDQIKGIATYVKEVNERCDEFVTTETAESEFGKVMKYDMNVLAILFWIRHVHREQAK